MLNFVKLWYNYIEDIKVQGLPERKQMKTISIMNQKGGVMKTTITTNIGYTLANKGHKVLIIDTEQQGSVLRKLGWDETDLESLETTLFDILVSPNTNTIQAAKIHFDAKRLEGTLDVIPSNFRMAFITTELDNNVDVITNSFKGLIEYAQNNKYDYVLIDTAPSFGILHTAILNVTDEVIVPTTLDQDSIGGVKVLYKLLKAAGFGKKLKAIIPTQVKPRTRLHATELEELKEAFPKLVTNNVIEASISPPTFNRTHALPISAHPKAIKAKMIYPKIITELNLKTKTTQKTASSKAKERGNHA